MSGDAIVLELSERKVVRKGLRGLRESGQIPAVIHNHGQASIHVMADAKQMQKTYSAAGKHHPVQLTVGKEQHLALIKDVDFEPAKHRMRHIVFQAIKQNEETEAEVPVVFKQDTEIPAEKASLLVLKQLDHVQVKALPRDLPDELVIDPTTLAEVGDSLAVADIKPPEGVTILTDPLTQVAVVEMPKDQVAEADAAAASLAEDAGVSEEAESEESTEEAGSEEKADKAKEDGEEE